MIIGIHISYSGTTKAKNHNCRVATLSKLVTDIMISLKYLRQYEHIMYNYTSQIDGPILNLE